MNINRRKLLGVGAAALAMPTLSFGARAQTPAIKIGVLTDFSGPYRDLTGPSAVTCVEQAVAEFTAANPDMNVEIVQADHQNKTDIGASVVREWFDRGGVDAICNLGNSAVALACNSVAEEKDKVHLNTAAGVATLTGEKCSPNLVHWTYDTWNLAHSTATSVTKLGGDKWFFVSADYAFGHSTVEIATPIIEANGGSVVGQVFFPFPGTTDFASYILQAQSSGANVVAFATGGADFVNFITQAQSFGLVNSGVRMVGMTGFITDIVGMGLPLAQGITLTENFYWDLNDRTRAWYQRIKPRLPAGVVPNMNHAGDYACVMHYLKAVKEMGVENAKASGRATVDTMKKMPTDDDCFGPGKIREDGRKIHPAYLFEAKTPDTSKAPDDLYKVLATMPAEEAFRPIEEGGCHFI